jgi:exopolysaccharide biosynthesis protein
MEQIRLDNYPYAKILKIKKNEVEKIDFALCNQPTETIDSYYKRHEKKPDIICNGGFFAMSTGNTVFHYIDEYLTVSTDKRYLQGIGIKDNNLILGQYNLLFKDFVSAYPVLISNGKDVVTDIGKEIDYNARRTIIGFNNDYIFLVLVDSYGYNFKKCRQLLHELGITDAVNLDGGGSTRALLKGKLITSDAVYNRPVDNVVCFYLKPEIKTIYRVQTGAFGSRVNAEKYLEKIKVLNDSIGAGYKNAYIRYIDRLYKVQVGAFGNKNNAEKVVNDLKSKGYSAFIVSETREVK